MDTLKINSVKKVRVLIDEINSLSSNYVQGSDEKRKLGKSIVELEDLMWKLINNDIKNIINQLKNSKDRLSSISNELKQEDENLIEMSKKINKVADIVTALVTVVSTATSVGII